MLYYIRCLYSRLGVPDCPLQRCGDRLFHDGPEVEAARGNDAPNGGNEFAFGGAPVARADCLFGAMAFEGFLREC